MTIAQGVSKQTRIKRQAGLGQAAGTSGGQILRRESSTFELQKENYTTESEITSTQQLKNNRHGIKLVPGKLSGIFTPGTYAEVFSALLRKDFAAGGSATGLTDVTAAVTSGYAGTFTQVAGSWFTQGFKVGQVVRPSGYATTGASNNGRNFLITALTAKVMTVLSLTPVAVGAKAGGDTVAFATPGKISYVPASGHTNIYHAVEEWYPDASISELNTDCQVASADISIPGSGNAKVEFAFTGLNQTKDTVAYFTSPAAESNTNALTSASGVLMVNGVAMATITTLSIKIDGKVQAADGVVGSNVRPDVFRGKVMVTGSFTCYFEGGTVPDLFRDETSTGLIGVLTDGLTSAADFVTLSLPQIDLNSSTPDDSETGLKRTYNFVAEYYAAGGTGTAHNQTTIQMHDSQAA